MKHFYRLGLVLGLFALTHLTFGQNDLVITAVFDGDLSGGLPKGVEIYAINSVADLSVYSIGSANNGGGTDGPEFALSGSVDAGNYFYVASEVTSFTAFFGFGPTLNAGSVMGINGDDAVELFYDASGNFSGDESIVDTYGVPSVNGDGEVWDYTDGWAYRNNSTGPDGNTFNGSSWTYSGLGGLDGESTNASASNPIPIGTYTIGADMTPPTFESGFPEITSITGNGATLRVQLDEEGRYYYVVLADGADAPTSAEVKAGTGNLGTMAIANDNSVAGSTTVNLSRITPLAAETSFDIYVVAEDDEGTPNLQATPTLLEFTTAVADNTAPAFINSTPFADEILDTQFNLNLELDELGFIYYVLLADGATAPTFLEVQAGTGSGGTASITSDQLFFGNLGIGLLEEITGLTASTPYDLYVAAEDDETTGNESSVTLVEVTTAAPKDTDSDITAATTPIIAGNVASTIDTEGEAVAVFNFKIDDLGTGDGLPTEVETIVITPAINNTAAWSTTLGGAKLNDGSDITTDGVTITDSDITF
ncbi:MAG: hypothetical protein AAFY41_06680, partial [Bacteroidota bacterium]